MDEWTPEAITAHMAFQHEVARMLTERGEFVDAQALSPQGAWVQHGGPEAALVVTDGPFPETEGSTRRWGSTTGSTPCVRICRSGPASLRLIFAPC